MAKAVRRKRERASFQITVLCLITLLDFLLIYPEVHPTLAQTEIYSHGNPLVLGRPVSSLAAGAKITETRLSKVLPLSTHPIPEPHTAFDPTQADWIPSIRIFDSEEKSTLPVPPKKVIPVSKEPPSGRVLDRGFHDEVLLHQAKETIRNLVSKLENLAGRDFSGTEEERDQAVYHALTVWTRSETFVEDLRKSIRRKEPVSLQSILPKKLPEEGPLEELAKWLGMKTLTFPHLRLWTVTLDFHSKNSSVVLLVESPKETFTYTMSPEGKLSQS